MDSNVGAAAATTYIATADTTAAITNTTPVAAAATANPRQDDTLERLNRSMARKTKRHLLCWRRLLRRHAALHQKLKASAFSRFLKQRLGELAAAAAAPANVEAAAQVKQQCEREWSAMTHAQRAAYKDDVVLPAHLEAQAAELWKNGQRVERVVKALRRLAAPLSPPIAAADAAENAMHVTVEL